MVKFFYTTIKGWKGNDVTYAAAYDHVDKNRMMVSFARCSDKDKFSKEKARLISRGRLEVGKFEVVTKDDNRGKYESLIAAIESHEQKVKENYRTQA